MTTAQRSFFITLVLWKCAATVWLMPNGNALRLDKIRPNDVRVGSGNLHLGKGA